LLSVKPSQPLLRFFFIQWFLTIKLFVTIRIDLIL
jgi:hypothetical protein